MYDEFNPDPLNLESADCEIRIEKLRREIQETTGTKMVGGKMSDCDPDVEEAFLEHVLALENHGFVSPFDTLICEGFDLPTPQELNDTALTAKLQELIQALAAHRLFLHNTDHLSNRELYVWLWCEGLREEMMGFGLPMGSWHLDVLGAGREEDIILHMRYYADEEERARWAADLHGFPMPPHERPPYDRDRHLPQAEP